MKPNEPMAQDKQTDTEKDTYKGELLIEHGNTTEGVDTVDQNTPGNVIEPNRDGEITPAKPYEQIDSDQEENIATELPQDSSGFGFAIVDPAEKAAQDARLVAGIDPASPAQQTPPQPNGYYPDPSAQYGIPLGYPGVQQTAPKSKYKKFLIIALIILLVIGGSSGFIFAYYIPNTPAGAWKTGFERTGKEFAALTEKLSDPEALKSMQKSTFKMDGTVKTIDGEFTATLDSKIDQTNSDSSLEVGFSAEEITAKLQAQIKTQLPENAVFPNLYFKITGLEDLGLDAYLGDISKIEDQWIAIEQEHLAELQESMDVPTDESKNLTQADIASVMSDVNALAQEYIFTSNPQMAVIQMDTFEGAEESEGITANHYKAKINKDNLQRFCVASIDKLSANEVIKTYSGETDEYYQKAVESARENCKKSADEIKITDTFDLWIDKNYKLIHKVRLYENFATKNAELQTQYDDCVARNNRSTFGVSYCDYIKNQMENGERYVDIGQTYKGNDTFDFFLNYVSNTDKNKGNITLKTQVNTKTYAIEGNITGKLDEDGQEVALDITMKTEPYDGEIDSEKPSGAIGIDEVYDLLLGSYGLEDLTASEWDTTNMEAETESL